MEALTTMRKPDCQPRRGNQSFRNAGLRQMLVSGVAFMTLQRLARELDETARQTASLVDAIGEALAVLSNKELSAEYARREAITMIVSALQGQDRIEQRCQNMALAVRQFALLPPTTPDEVYDEIWGSLILDELRVPSLSGIAAKPSRGEVELF
jgi:hypothetical protein